MSLSSIPRPLVRSLAVVFLLATTAYSFIWMYYIRRDTMASLGIEGKPEVATRITITHLKPGGSAQQAGLHLGDEILAVNNHPVTTLAGAEAVARGNPGDVVSLLVQRPGVDAPFTVSTTLEPPREQAALTWAQAGAIQVIQCFPLMFLVVGSAVLWLRPDDRNAWLLALMFAGIIAAAPLAFAEQMMLPWLRRFAFPYQLALYGINPAIFYYFFATFPTASPIDRRIPWLKRWLLILAAIVSLPLAVAALVAGSLRPVIRFGEALPHEPTNAIVLTYIFGSFALGMISLLWSSLRSPTIEARRKTRVMVWGTVAGLAPYLLVSAWSDYLQRSYYQSPFWVWSVSILAIFLMPLSFAYAVVKHRVLEIPLLLRRSARYMLVQRGFVVLILVAGVVATLLLAGSLRHYFPSHSELGVPLGAGFGILLVFTGTQVQTRVTRRLDRAFFRSSYDARLILEDLAAQSRTAFTRTDLAALLSGHIRQALHPSGLVIYLAGEEENLVAQEGPPELQSLSPDASLLRMLAQQGHPWEVPPGPEGEKMVAMLQPLQPECLVPILGREGRLLGLLVLGSRLSDEPYSREDKRLLASVAGQAGISIENIKLAKQMVESMEAERRATQELEIARQVQMKLLPQKPPALATLDYAGTCIQARAVGGDYYDFLDLGAGRVGFVLADIVGKGISAALLMANLQAQLRSLSAVLAQDLAKSLQSVNRMFCEATEPNKFATLFIGVYEDATRCLRYANCGHHPPLLLRENALERLTSTATVLGMFEQWECSLAETRLAPGDLLTIYTDGVVEAMNALDEEFGEAGLLQTLRKNRQQCSQAILDAILADVHDFASGEQSDDLTLVVACAR